MALVLLCASAAGCASATSSSQRLAQGGDGTQPVDTTADARPAGPTGADGAPTSGSASDAAAADGAPFDTTTEPIADAKVTRPDTAVGPSPDAVVGPPPAPDAAPPECAPPAPPAEVRVGGGFAGKPQCGPLSWFAVAPVGMRLHLSARGVPPGVTLAVTDPTGAQLATERADDRGVVSVHVTPLQSGELRWTFETSPDSPPGRLSGSLICEAGCDLEATRYPIVLLHGMGGTDRYFGLLEYFYQVTEQLGGRGFATFTPVVPIIGSSDVRAAALAPQIDAILAQTGAAKVHLIAHSQGGLDVRVLVSGLGYADRVASVTTISAPHRGIPFDLPEWLSGQDFSRAGMEAFALQYPDVDGMPSFSWAGHTCGLLEADCRAAHQDELVDPLLAPSHAALSAEAADDGEGGANDGVVLVSSARWGVVLGELPADHFDEVGQIADAAPAPFDHRAFYLSEARRLRQLEIDRGL